MVDEHHRLTRAQHPAPGVRRSDYRALRASYPDAGCRRMLVRAFGRGLRERPTRPLPMLKP